MKTKLHRICLILLSGLLFFTGCRKEINEQSITSAVSSQLESDANANKNGCRLAFATNSDITGIYDFTFHYNAEGLADEWDIANYGVFTQEYDVRGKLRKSTATVNGDVASITYFFYKGGDKVAKEVVYDGTGTYILDVAYYTYNLDGKIVKVQSFMNDWLTTTTYTPEGNLSESDLFFSGFPVYSAIWTYSKGYKNPYLAVPGIDHAFPFYTPADFFSSKWTYASLKQLGFDEYGNAVEIFDYDPSQTKWQADQQNHAVSADYYDLLSGGWFTYNYEFENCNVAMENNAGNSQVNTSSNVHVVGKINPMMLLLRNPAKSMKEQVMEFRQQIKNIKSQGIKN